MGSSFNDTIVGDAQSNMLRGGNGDDTIDGGDGLDWADYAEATGAGVNVVLKPNGLGFGTAMARLVDPVNNSTVKGSTGIDTLISIERVRGSNFDDYIQGDDNDNVIRGLGGNNTIDGGGGFDFVDYAQASAGVNVDLANAATGITVTHRHGQNTFTDQVKNVEGVIGSAFSDTITGGAGGNEFISLGGNDSYDGRDGVDKVNYQYAAARMDINLATGNTSGWTSDRLDNIENVRGTEFNDLIIGNAADNDIIGGLGSDTIVGGGGNDTIDLVALGTAFGTGPGSTVKMQSLSEGTDTVLHFTANHPGHGGDLIDLSGITGFGAQGTRVQELYGRPLESANFEDANVFIFGDTPLTRQDVSAAVAKDSDVTASQGYLIFRDAANNNQTTIFHSSDLAGGGAGALTALLVLDNVSPTGLHASNLIL